MFAGHDSVLIKEGVELFSGECCLLSHPASVSNYRKRYSTVAVTVLWSMSAPSC